MSERASAIQSVSSKPTAVQYLVFMVSGAELGVALERVSEIIPYERVSEVPGAPAWVRGVVHLRGRVIPVVDLALKMQRQPQPIGKRTCILMLDLEHAGQKLELGVVMDSVAKLVDAERSQIKPPPLFGRGVEVQLLEGLLPTERGMLPLLNVERVFANDELSTIASTAAAL